MNRSEYSSEDFVLDAEFREWVFNPNQANRKVWEKFLEEHPAKASDIHEAKLLLINLSKKSYIIPSSKEEELWSRIADSLVHVDVLEKETPIIPITPKLQLPLRHRKPFLAKRLGPVLIALLIVGIVGSWLFYQSLLPPTVTSEVVAEEWVEHHVPKGQKSKITLTDGTKVIVNSGSTLRHIKNLGETKREIFLTGEAYFEVAKDKNRPFSVISNGLTAKALGTIFNVNSRSNSHVQVSLLEGSVLVSSEDNQQLLSPGNAAVYSKKSGLLNATVFDEEQVLAWTKKVIFLKDAHILEVFETLENWYGVEIVMVNSPKKEIFVTGKYQDEMLKSVLSGLSYTAGFTFEIKDKNVTIKFS